MGSAMKEATVSLPNDQQVRVVRSFKSARSLVFRAFTEPALFRRWCTGYPGWSMPVCDMDVRVGGKFRWQWRSDDDGSQFGFHGVFRTVEAPSKLVHTELFDPGDVGGSMGEAGEALITVTFTEKAGVTTMTALIDYGSKVARDAAMATGMTDGMEYSYQLLDEVLAAEAR